MNSPASLPTPAVLSADSQAALESGYWHVIAQRDALVMALERIAAADANHLQFAALVKSEARAALEAVQP